MKQLYLFLSFCFVFNPVFSQKTISFPTLSDEPQWYLKREHMSYDTKIFNTYSLLTYQKDTVLCGNTYIKSEVDKRVFFVRNEGNKTYLKASSDCSDKEQLIYDFDMKVNDTLLVFDRYSAFAKDRYYRMKVTNVDSVVYNGIARKRLSIAYRYSNYSPSTMDWVEGVGSSEHPFYPLVPLNSYQLDGARFYSLCTYNKQNLVFSFKNAFCAATTADTSVFPMATNGAHWSIGTYATFFPPYGITGTKYLYYNNDSIICNKKYSRIFLEGQVNKTVAFVRTEGAKVYHFPKDATCSDDEELLYDFSLEKDEMTYINHPSDGKEYVYEVTKVEKVQMLGKLRKKITLRYKLANSSTSNPYYYDDIWLEGVGSLQHPFHFFLIPAIDGYWYELLCSWSGNVQQYQNPKYAACASTVATKDAYNHNVEVSISPNPFSNLLSINVLDYNKPVKVYLYNTMGQIQLQQSFEEKTSLNTESLPQGTYILKIQSDDNQKIAIKKIIKIVY